MENEILQVIGIDASYDDISNKYVVNKIVHPEIYMDFIKKTTSKYYNDALRYLININVITPIIHSAIGDIVDVTNEKEAHEYYKNIIIWHVNNNNNYNNAVKIDNEMINYIKKIRKPNYKPRRHGR